MRDSNPSAFSAALGALLPAPYNEQIHHTLTAYKGKELDNHLIQVRSSDGYLKIYLFEKLSWQSS